MKIAKLFFVLFIFLILANRHRHQHYYSPMYHFSDDPVFSYIRKSPTKGVLISGYVQSLRGLNVEVSTGKQYFVPMCQDVHFRGRTLSMYCCDGNIGSSYPEFVKSIVSCFQNRSKEDWLLLSEALDSNLILTRKEIEIPTLKKVASDDDFYLYEIQP